MSLHGDTLALESWRERNGIDPFHFWGWSCEQNCSDCSAHKRNCGRLWYSHFWQRNTVSRGDVRNAIDQARTLIHSHFDSHIGTEYVEEHVELPRHFNRLGCCDFSTLQLCNNHVQALGVQRVEKLEDVDINYLDESGEPFDFTNATEPPCWFTVTFTAPAGLDTNDLQAHFLQDDLPFGAGSVPTDESYVARIKWTYDSATGTVTGTGRPWLLAKPKLYEKPACCGLDCLKESNYVSQLTIYNVYHDSAGTDELNAAVLLYREEMPCNCNCCCGGTENRVSTGNIITTNSAGMIYIYDQMWNAETEQWESTCCKCGCDPNRAVIRYAAGLPNNQCIKIGPVLHMLATGIMPTICDDCGRGDEKQFSRWSHDYTYTARDVRLNLGFELLENPFGMTEGAIRAYQQLKNTAGLKVPRVALF